MAIVDKNTGRDVEYVRDVVDDDMSERDLSRSFGYLLEVLHEKKVISDQEVLDMVAGSWRFYEVRG